MLGNKDNHARNTAVYRFETGEVCLTPLFDFAPICLDPGGIARVCRWEWGLVLERYRDQLPDGAARLREFGKRLRLLPEFARDAGVDDDIIEHQSAAISDHAGQLESLGTSK